MVCRRQKFFIKTIFIPLLLVGIISCEGYRVATGIVKDQGSNLALDSVYVHVTNGSDKFYTDSTGIFKVNGPFGSCMSGCKDVIIEFSKRGYKTQQLQNPDAEVIVLLERQ